MNEVEEARSNFRYVFFLVNVTITVTQRNDLFSFRFDGASAPVANIIALQHFPPSLSDYLFPHRDQSARLRQLQLTIQASSADLSGLSTQVPKLLGSLAGSPRSAAARSPNLVSESPRGRSLSPLPGDVSFRALQDPLPTETTRMMDPVTPVSPLAVTEVAAIHTTVHTVHTPIVRVVGERSALPLPRRVDSPGYMSRHDSPVRTQTGIPNLRERHDLAHIREPHQTRAFSPSVQSEGGRGQDSFRRMEGGQRLGSVSSHATPVPLSTGMQRALAIVRGVTPEM